MGSMNHGEVQKTAACESVWWWVVLEHGEVAEQWKRWIARRCVNVFVVDPSTWSPCHESGRGLLSPGQSVVLENEVIGCVDFFDLSSGEVVKLQENRQNSGLETDSDAGIVAATERIFTLQKSVPTRGVSDCDGLGQESL